MPNYVNPSRAKRAAPLMAGWSAVFIWAAAPVLFKLCSLEAPLAFVLVLRFSICCVVLLPSLRTLYHYRTQIPLKPALRMWFWTGINFYFAGTALTMLPASVYIIVYSLVPLLSLFVLRLPVTPLKWGLSIAAAVGCCLLVESHPSAQEIPPLSLLFISTGMVGWVFFTKEFSKLQSHLPDFQLSTLTHLGMFVVSLVWWIVIGTPVVKLSGAATVSIVLLGLSSPIAFFLFSYALRCNQVFAIVSQYCEPVFGILLASVLLREHFTSLQWIGAAFVLLAVFGTDQKR